LHRGIDIAVPKGTPVIATADGEVVYAAYSKNGYGRLVRIAHGGGIETWYAHLKSLDVRQGARVKQGQQIGRVGRSGRTTGFHIHYEVHVNGEAVEPRRYLPASL
jgi:murein DD-endopeptidase MepM/ murein hydrolase activator NlpD